MLTVLCKIDLFPFSGGGCRLCQHCAAGRNRRGWSGQLSMQRDSWAIEGASHLLCASGIVAGAICVSLSTMCFLYHMHRAHSFQPSGHAGAWAQSYQGQADSCQKQPPRSAAGCCLSAVQHPADDSLRAVYVPFQCRYRGLVRGNMLCTRLGVSLKRLPKLPGVPRGLPPA